jgi:DcuC family C4-dicarboxylate transporter
MQQILALAIVVVGAFFAARRVDIRIVLAGCAFALFALARDVAPFFVTFAEQMANPGTVVPICSAMGFAYVVKSTGCDRDLVFALTAPLRLVRSIMVPGGVAVGFTVNTAIVSQSSTAATVGPVLVPVVVASGIPLVTAAAVLLLGSSVGGELVNPGAVEIVTLSKLVGAEPTEIVRRILPFNLVASAAATILFAWLAVARPPADPAPPEPAPIVDGEPDPPPPPETAEPARVNPIKAAVPLLPLAILFVAPHAVALPEAITNTILIAAAMLTGVLAAGLAAPRRARDLGVAFFEGAGFAYSRVISLIVTATLFTEAIKANGLIERLTDAIATEPALATATSVAVPLLLAAVSGSGIAPAVAVMNVLVPVAATAGLDPVRIGALCAVSAQLGRTMSPAAAVVMMSSAVAGVPPEAILRRVVAPLLGGALALLGAALAGIV